MGNGDLLITINNENNLLINSEIKSHNEITDLIDNLKNVEDSFSNLDFLQDLPEMIQFPSEDITETELSPKTEIALEEFQTEIKEDTLYPEEPPISKEIKENTAELFQELKGLPALKHYLHQHIAHPLLGPPAPGHTTFTVELTNNKVSGFFHINKDTRSFKELGPFISNKAKNFLKLIRQRDIKKDLKNIKSLPTILKKKSKMIKINSIKNIPKIIRNKISSD